jgi:hypothetical protein
LHPTPKRRPAQNEVHFLNPILMENTYMPIEARTKASKIKRYWENNGFRKIRIKRN